MKNLRLVAALAAFFATFLFAGRSTAQQMVTVRATPEGFNQMVTQNTIGGVRIAPQENSYMIVNGSAPYQPPVQPFCFDELTPALIQQIKDAANACCCRIFFCVQRSDCAFYAMYMDPTNCPIQPPVFQAVFQAYLY